MAELTAIGWCDSTFNPWIGCTKVSPACDNCYAAADMDLRRHRVQWGAGQARLRTREAYWKQPLTWNRKDNYFQCRCGIRGEFGAFAEHPDCPIRPTRRRVFCASLADVFDNEVDPQWRADLFALIRATPNLDWLLLTKRIGNADRMIAEAVSSLPRDRRNGTGQFDHTPMAQWPWPNVWLGATIANQAEADRDIPKLLAAPAAVRFLSVEPLLGPVDLTDLCQGHTWRDVPRDYWVEDFDTEESPPALRIDALAGRKMQRFGDYSEPTARIDWVIAGGESGPGARPMHPHWARGLRDQCVEARTPFFFKQWGEWAPAEIHPGGDLGGELRRGKVQHLHAPGNPEGFFRAGDAYVRRIGKKAAGRLLDGQEHSAFPGGPW